MTWTWTSIFVHIITSLHLYSYTHIPCYIPIIPYCMVKPMRFRSTKIQKLSRIRSDSSPTIQGAESSPTSRILQGESHMISRFFTEVSSLKHLKPPSENYAMVRYVWNINGIWMEYGRYIPKTYGRYIWYIYSKWNIFWNITMEYVNQLYISLVVWNIFFLCFHILGIIISTDFYIFQRGRSTTNQIYKWAMFSSIFRYFSELIG